MEDKQLKVLEAKYAAFLTPSEIKAMEEREWSREAKEKFSSQFEADFDSLSLEQQVSTYTISTSGSRSWRYASVTVEGNSVIELFGDYGEMRYGTSPDRFCGPPGLNARDGGNTVPTMNGGCFLVGISSPFFPDELKVYFRNSTIKPYGASIGTPGVVWDVAAAEGGELVTAFNDNYDADNSGSFVQKITIYPANVFAKMQRFLRQSLE